MQPAHAPPIPWQSVANIPGLRRTSLLLAQLQRELGGDSDAWLLQQALATTLTHEYLEATRRSYSAGYTEGSVRRDTLQLLESSDE